jgi:hypothetical protein
MRAASCLYFVLAVISAAQHCNHKNGMCWSNISKASHLGNFTTKTSDPNAEVLECCTACSNTANCAHWHLKPQQGKNPECHLRTEYVKASSQRCITDAGSSPTPAPISPTPAPLPTPKPQPSLGYQPHIIFHLADVRCHRYFGTICMLACL